jgi:hypothetical protein
MAWFSHRRGSGDTIDSSAFVDKDTARTLAVAAKKSSSMLTNLLPDLKQRCRAAEYEELRKAIGAIAGISALKCCKEYSGAIRRSNANSKKPSERSDR